MKATAAVIYAATALLSADGASVSLLSDLPLKEAMTNIIFGARRDGEPPSPGAVLRPATEHTRVVEEEK